MALYGYTSNAGHRPTHPTHGGGITSYPPSNDTLSYYPTTTNGGSGDGNDRGQFRFFAPHSDIVSGSDIEEKQRLNSISYRITLYLQDFRERYEGWKERQIQTMEEISLCIPRKPLFVLSGIAVLVTLRAAKSSIKSTRVMSFVKSRNGNSVGYGNAAAYGATRPSSSYQSTSSGRNGLYSNSGTTTGRSMSSSSVASYSSLTDGSVYGSGTAQTSGSSGGSTGTYNAALSRSSGGNTYNSASAATSGYGSLRTSSSTSASAPEFSLADLCDAHCDTYGVQFSSPEEPFHDYGGKPAFWGEVVSIQSFESTSVVESTLSATMSKGKVLVVDGGGSKKAAVFDSKLAELAERNGWKGIIVNGCVRGADDMEHMTKIGVKALCTSPKKGLNTKNTFDVQNQQGQQFASVRFASVVFNTGEYVFVDKDGFLVSSQKLPIAGGQDVSLSSSSTYRSTGGGVSPRYDVTGTDTSSYGGGLSSSSISGGSLLSASSSSSSSSSLLSDGSLRGGLGGGSLKGNSPSSSVSSPYSSRIGVSAGGMGTGTARSILSSSYGNGASDMTGSNNSGIRTTNALQSTSTEYGGRQSSTTGSLVYSEQSLSPSTISSSYGSKYSSYSSYGDESGNDNSWLRKAVTFAGGLKEKVRDVKQSGLMTRRQ